MLKKRSNKQQNKNEEFISEHDKIIDEIISLVGGYNHSKSEIIKFLEENNFEKERTIEKMIEKRGK